MSEGIEMLATREIKALDREEILVTEASPQDVVPVVMMLCHAGLGCKAQIVSPSAPEPLPISHGVHPPRVHVNVTTHRPANDTDDSEQN